MFKKNKTVLEFKSLIDVYPDSIVPIKKIIPQWYKDAPGVGNNMVDDQGNLFHSFKQCLPFLDGFTTGYAMLLPFDILITKKEDRQIISWNHLGQPIISVRQDGSHDAIPVPQGYSSLNCVWSLSTIFKIPSDYSLLFMHPLNRYDLPFITMAGIIDGGFAMHPYGNIPFFLKEGFEGIIPQGTPIAQIIPFKTENWKSLKNKDLIQQGEETRQKHFSVISGWYKNNLWKRKKFE